MTAGPLLRILAECLLVGYLPGALIFRLPFAHRERRAALAAEERAFWAVMLSVIWSLACVLGLAALERYSFSRLLAANGLMSFVLLASSRTGLLYRGQAARPTWHLLVPIALIALGIWRFFPSAEYIIGGKDPGVYVNEGVQIAERGTLEIHDATVAAVPAATRDLFFPSYQRDEYYSLRFMGFFVQNPATGDVIGQQPQFYPASIAIGYGINGLSGVRETTGVWAILGLLAVYFAGSRLAGRAAAAAAAGLLGLHVIEVWFARCPNADIVMQAMLFAGLLAFARAHQDDDGFFGPVAGALLGLLVFLKVDALLAWAAIGTAMTLGFGIARRPIRAGFIAVFAVCLALGAAYLTGPLRAYLWLPIVYLTNLPPVALAAGSAALVFGAAALFWARRHDAGRARALVPYIVILVAFALTTDALAFRHPVGPDAPGPLRLAPYDAYALRTFVSFYLFEPGLIAALLGFALLVRRRFWDDPALILTFVAFSGYLFYKLHIVPEHFWMTRRLIPVILPGALLFIGTAALWTMRGPKRGLHLVRPVIGVVFLALLGQQYARAAAPILPHVEYAGVIPFVESLSERFSDRDLILVESRNAGDGSDTHVLALPLAYIYARHVLVFDSPKPDPAQLRAFLADAFTRYPRVFFIGGGGTSLLSRQIHASPLPIETVSLPEYDSPFDAYPSGVRRKDFDFGVYQLTMSDRPAEPFALDVGGQDDLNVVRFFAKEPSEGRSIRWSRAQSFIEAQGLSGAERQVTFVMSSGGRPAAAPPARVEVLFDGTPIGGFDVAQGFASYSVALPPALAAAAAARDQPAEITLRCSTWSPRALLHLSDDRQLGVMVDRVEIH